MLLAEDLKNAILQYAMQGKLVKQNPNDEPASILLEKIKAEKEELIKNNKFKKGKPIPPITEDDIPYELPDGWEWVRLPDILNKICAGGDKPKIFTKHKTDKNIYPVIANGEKNNGVLGYSDIPVIKEKSITVSGRGTMGFTCIREPNYIPIVRLLVLIPSKYIDIKFLKYLLTYLSENGQGTAVKQLTVPMLSMKVISLPPLAEQKRIVEKLETILPLIDKYGEKEKKLEELNINFKNEISQSILQSALKGELSRQLETDSNVEDYIKLANEIKINKKQNNLLNNTKKTEDVLDEGLFDIPDSWRWVRLGNIVDFRMGKTPDKTDVKSYGNDYPWVKIGDIENDGTVNSTSEKISEYGFKNTFSEKISPKGTLIMSFKLTIGKVAILDIDALHNEAIISIFPFVEKDNITRDYLFKVLPYISQSGDFKSAIKGKTLNANSLTNLLVPLPPIEEQKRIVEKLDKIMPLVNNLVVQ